jgi:hypothetical protein
MMGYDAAVWLGLSLFAVGFVFGGWSGMLLRASYNEINIETHKLELLERDREIARLRAQVALHIGKEKNEHHPK